MKLHPVKWINMLNIHNLIASSSPQGFLETSDEIGGIGQIHYFVPSFFKGQ
jgi:hypothetical protein